MHNKLIEARKFAESIKFSADTSRANLLGVFRNEENLKGVLYASELLISKEVTPSLYNSLKSVLFRLDIPERVVQAFVYPSPELNANCFLNSHEECTLRISSSLIEILTSDELEFVIGHELGHFLLSHSSLPGRPSIEDYIEHRAKEISADRIGFVGCESLNVSIKALMKTASGLSDHYLKFDISSFISQIKKTTSEYHSDLTSSHPTILVRCRALLLFSLSHTHKTKDLKSIDEKIIAELDRYIDQSARKIIGKAIDDVSIWLMALKIARKNKFSKEDQLNFKSRFGESTLDSFINFINSVESSDLEFIIKGKLKQSKAILKEIIPNSYEQEMKKLNSLY